MSNPERAPAQPYNVTRAGDFGPVSLGQFDEIVVGLVDDPGLRLAELRHEASVRAERLARSIGAAVLERKISSNGEMSLQEAIQRAHETNDPEAVKLIEDNVRTDYIERMLKSGHVSTTRQRLNENGQIEQNGHTAEQIQRNTLKYADANDLLRPRTQSETANMYYLEALAREGLLEDNYAVVVSLCPDYDDDTLDKLNFFSFSKSLSIQATTKSGGEIITESAFIAGVPRPGAARQDHKTAVAFGKQYGEDWEGLSDSEIIKSVVLIPKEMMSRGVIDLVEQWDDLAGNAFFGLDAPRQNYTTHLEQCRARERAFEPTVQKIVAELISRAPRLRTPLEATRELDAISKKFALEYALTDKTIDERVFGSRAAADLAAARHHQMQGNMRMVQQSMTRAHKYNASGSCPSGASSYLMGEVSPFNEDGTLKTPEQLAEEELEGASREGGDEYGSLKFVCQKGHPNSRPRGKLISHCKSCGIDLSCGMETLVQTKTNKMRTLGQMIVLPFWKRGDTKTSSPKAPKQSDLALAA